MMELFETANKIKFGIDEWICHGGFESTQMRKIVPIIYNGHSKSDTIAVWSAC